MNAAEIKKRLQQHVDSTCLWLDEAVREGSLQRAADFHAHARGMVYAAFFIFGCITEDEAGTLNAQLRKAIRP